MNNTLNLKIINKYKNSVLQMIHFSYPELASSEILDAIDYSIMKRMKNHNIILENNYKNKKIDSTIIDITEFILEQEPIITANGVLYKKRLDSVNPIANLMQRFLAQRKIYKKEMYKHLKGNELYEKYDLLQLLSKIDANSLYGTLGSAASIFFNIYCASSITAQGRSLNATAGLMFEMFISNNVAFRSLNEIINFIDNTTKEKDNRGYSDKDILDNNIDLVTCFEKIIFTSGQGYKPSMRDLEIIWNIMSRLEQEELNRLYYKNNLFEFMSNSSMEKAMLYLLQKLNIPFVDPNNPPTEIKVELDELNNILREYVWYGHHIIDRIPRMLMLPRKVSMLYDTDSQIINLDGWYRFILNKVYNVPMKIKTMITNPMIMNKLDEFGDVVNPVKIMEICEPVYDYNFYTDEVIEVERTVNPLNIIPQDGLRYSIINILSYCVGNLVNEYLGLHVEYSNALEEGKCFMSMKNEFLFKIILLHEGQKNYAAITEFKEGNKIPKGEEMQITGLAMDKSSLNQSTRDRLKYILYEDILSVGDEIDQIKILKDLIIFEKQIYQSLVDGSKEYYKPATMKSISSYDNPMSYGPIKAAYAWNELIQDGYEIIDLDKRNSVDIAKLDLNIKNVDKIKDTNPEMYNRILKLLNTKEFKGSITSIAIPLNQPVPEWVLIFINYKELINGNLSTFPMKAIGLEMAEGNVNYTNILKI